MYLGLCNLRVRHGDRQRARLHPASCDGTCLRTRGIIPFPFYRATSWVRRYGRSSRQVSKSCILSSGQDFHIVNASKSLRIGTRYNCLLDQPILHTNEEEISTLTVDLRLGVATADCDHIRFIETTQISRNTCTKGWDYFGVDSAYVYEYTLPNCVRFVY